MSNAESNTAPRTPLGEQDDSRLYAQPETARDTRLRSEMQAAYDAAVQRVIDRFQGDVRAMAAEIVRLRDELMVSESLSDE